MRVKGITAAAIAALALVGCAQPNEEKAEADDILTELLTIQSALVSEQQAFTEQLEGPLRPKALKAFLNNSFRPEARALEGLSISSVSSVTKTAADKSSAAGADAGALADHTEEMLEGLRLLEQFPELNKNLTEYPTAGLSDVRDEANSVEAESVSLERLLLRSLTSSAAALSSIEVGLEKTGNMDERAENLIEENRNILDALDERAGLASAEFKIGLEDELGEGIAAIEESRSSQMPDGACQKLGVPYPSTLGTPSVYVYVFPGRVTCDFGVATVRAFYEDANARETGEGTITFPDDPEAPSLDCELGQISPIGDPRFVICEGEWVGETIRVSFEAPATAG